MVMVPELSTGQLKLLHSPERFMDLEKGEEEFCSLIALSSKTREL